MVTLRNLYRSECGEFYSNRFCLLLYHSLMTLFQETMRLQTEQIDGIKAVVNESNARHFHVIIDGPGGVSVPGQ